VYQLADAIKDFGVQNGKHAYNVLLDVLSIATLKNVNDPPPTILEFIEGIRRVGKIDNNSVQKSVIAALPKNCTADTANCQLFFTEPLNEDDILKQFIRDADDADVPLDKEKLASKNCLSYLMDLSKWGLKPEVLEKIAAEQAEDDHADEVVFSEPNDKKADADKEGTGLVNIVTSSGGEAADSKSTEQRASEPLPKAADSKSTEQQASKPLPKKDIYQFYIPDDDEDDANTPNPWAYIKSKDCDSKTEGAAIHKELQVVSWREKVETFINVLQENRLNTL
jgi:hypothetical protein